jgi:hypothetical protein
MDILSQKFTTLLDELNNNPSIKVEGNNFSDSIRKRPDKIYEWEFQSALKQNIKIPQEDKKFLEVATAQLDWTNAVGDFNEFIYGGFQMLGYSEVLYTPSFFWDRYDNKESKENLSKLGAFHKSGHGDDGTFGCFFREGNYPFPIYFYDNGVSFKLDLSLDQYYEEMLRHKAVMLWQYFYISPQEIIEKLSTRDCKIWIAPFREVKGTRVDGVIEFISKVIRLFPNLFPELDMEFYENKKQELIKAYNDSKK